MVNSFQLRKVPYLKLCKTFFSVPFTAVLLSFSELGINFDHILQKVSQDISGFSLRKWPNKMMLL